jgi:glycosyltransferase involved in cell wall biosynthesis
MRFMESCLRNVIEQRCAEAEHIIVDGSSTDGTADVIQRYAGEYRHIRWISEPDQGQSDAMNKGLAAAAGGVIGFLNVDDYYEPGALSEALSMFSRLPEPSLLVGNCNIWDDAGKLLSVSRPAQISLLNLLKGRYEDAFPMNPAAYFYHRSLHEIIGPYPVGEHFGMDVDFIFRAVQKANVKYVNRTWGNYRYLESTKTFADVKSGMNSVRVSQIADHYRKQQPLYFRTYLSASGLLSRAMNVAYSIGSLLKRP